MLCSDHMSASHFIAQTSKFLLIDATAVTLDQGHRKVTQYIEPTNTYSDENDPVGPHDISAMCDGNDINVSTMPVNSCSMPVNSHSMPVNSHSMPENSHTDDNDPAVQLETFRAKHAKNLMISHYNVNSIRYKFSELQHILRGHFVDILGIAETKIDDTFFDGQFQMENYKLYRQDRNDRGGGIMMYINDNTPHRLLK